MAGLGNVSAPLLAELDRSPALSATCPKLCLPDAVSRPSSASSRTRTPSANASSRSSSKSSCSQPTSTGSVVLLPKVELQSTRREHSLTRSSSSSRSGDLDAGCQPILLQSSTADPSQKVAGRTVRRSGVLRKAALSSVADKGILPRRKTVPEAREKSSVVKLGRSHSEAGLTRHHSACKKWLPHEGAQNAAIKGLAAQLAASETSFEALMDSLCSPVLKQDGNTAFLPEHIRQAATFVLNGDDKDTACSAKTQQGLPVAQAEWKASVGPLAVRVLRVLARRASLFSADVSGQILWHFRKNKALQDPLMRGVANDLSWIDLLADEEMSTRPTELVESLFRKHAKDNGLLDERTFLKIMDRALHEYTVKVNGVTYYTGSRASCRRTDLDQLYYDQRNQRGEQGINHHGFQQALVKLAKHMSAHPRAIFTTVGRFGS